MAVTPYMLMDLPVVSSTLGPAWATKINAALTLNDAHDHSTGKGVPVRTAGLYMDADLDFRGTNPKNMRSVRFQLLSSLIGGVDDVCCLYFKGADLYVNDSAGNQIQITSGGGIIGTPGSISGLVSPATVTYTPASKTFNFYSDSLVRAPVGCGPLTIADPVTNGKGVTISVPSGLTGNYALELPGSPPGGERFLTVDDVGAVRNSRDVDNSTLEIKPGNLIGIKDLGVDGSCIANTFDLTTKTVLVAAPVSAANATTKAYVDSHISTLIHAKAWVNCNPGALVIAASYNVWLIEDAAENQIRLHFTNPIADTNYVCVGSCDSLSSPYVLGFGNKNVYHVDVSAIRSTDGAVMNLRVLTTPISVLIFR